MEEKNSDERMLNLNKRNLIAKLMREEFERKSLELLKNGGSLEEIDAALTPMMLQYFKESEALEEFYRAKGIDEAS